MASYRSTFENFYSDKTGFYSTIGAIVPVLVNNYTDSSNSETTESAEYAHNGFLYCDGDQYEIREYPLLYQLIKNDYNKSTETFSNNSIVFDSAGAAGTIYRTFINGGNLYAEIYDNENIGTDGGVTKVRSVPNKANLRFVDSLGSFPDGGIFEADEDYQLEYSEGFQDLATLSGTHVFRFLVDGAGASYDVVWSVSIPALIINSDGQYVLPDQYYGTVPFYDPAQDESNPALGISPSETGYDQYDDALNDSPQISWGTPSGLPTDITVDSYEIYLENRTVVEDLVHWHLKDIPSSVTFLAANAEPPTGSSFENPTVYDTVSPEDDGTRPWIRSNGYAGPQPEDGVTNIYVLNVIANLSNGQTLIVSREFIAGNNPLVTPVYGDPTYENNLTVQGTSSSITNTAFNVTFSSLTTHPEIRIKKNFTFSDYPYFLGKFRVPDYRDKKLIGYGEGVNGAGTALVGNAATIQVGDVGGQWFISTDVIEDPDEFFAISDVLTTGYSDVQTQIQPYLTGSKKYVVGPVGDYAFSKPAEHQHQLLNSIVYEGSETTVGGVDTFAVKYENTKGSVIDFTPGGENSDGLVLGHAHGLLGEKPINNSMATYGNVEGIGEKSEDSENAGCYLYGITESPPLDTTGVSSDGTYITVVVNGDHNLDVGDWVTITNGSTLNGSYQIISTGFTATTFKLQPDPAIATTTQNAAVVKQASGVFDTVTETPNPDVWAVDSNTVIGGKETIAFEADQYVLEVDEELESSGSISIGADDAGANAMKYEIKLYAPGGGGGGTTGNGGNAGNASVTFSIDGVSYTVSANGGSGGTSGNNGGDGGSGGTYTIPSALLTDDRVDISYDENGPDGTDGGSDDASTPAGGTQNGGPDAIAGNGGNGGYNTTPISGDFDKTFTSDGSYNAATDDDLPTISGTKATIDSIKLDISGGGGGNGNSNSNNNCSVVGGTGSKGRRVVGTANGTSFSFEIGTKGGNGFNNVSNNSVEATNTSVGTGPANGGNGGRGAWYNAGSGGAGGGATGVKNSVGWILGAGGGGGGGGTGGNGNNSDGCSPGNNGKGPEGNVVSTNNVAPYTGNGGGTGGCTAGGGGGGGGGWNDESVGGSAGSADGGAAGEPHPSGTTGGGGGGRTGGSAYNSTYVSAVTESNGSSSGGYVKFTVNYSGTQINKSGGGGGAGGAVVITLTGTKDDIGSFATAVTASLGDPGSAGSGGGNAGNAGYVQVRVFSIDPGEAEVVGVSTPAGRVWETEGFPTNTATGSGSTTGGAIWHSSSDDVNVKQSSTGTFANATTLSPVSNRFIEFAGSGNRFLQLGPLNLSAAEELYFTVIKGNGSNGGDAPEEPLELYYKTSVDSTSENLIQNIAAASVSASGWVNYKVELDEDSPARKNNVYLVIRQTRAAGSNDNDDTNEKNLDKWGLAQFAVVYGEVSKQVFTPSLNASIPGNDDDGDCGPDVGIDYVRRTVTAAKSNITFTDGTFQLSTSTPISVTGTASVVDPIPLITRYHRAKYLIKAF